MGTKPTARIEINEHTVGLWSVLLDETTNFLAHLGRAPSGTLQLIYRFRYEQDDKPGAPSKDDRHWFYATFRDDDVGAALATSRSIYLTTRRMGLDGWELLRSDYDSLLEFVLHVGTMPGMTESIWTPHNGGILDG